MNRRFWLIVICALSAAADCCAMRKNNEQSAGGSAHGHFEQLDRQCAVCASEIVGVMITLPCGHRFCEGCINEWRLRNEKAKCPTCRCDIPRLAGGSASGQMAFQVAQVPVFFVYDPHVLEHELMVALINRDFDRADGLFASGVDIHFGNDRLMRFAIEVANWQVLCWLLEHGADVHFDNEAAMRRALEAGEQGEEMRQYLAERGGLRTEVMWFLHDMRYDRETQVTVATSVGVFAAATLALGLLYERLRQR